jgi:hypothetical protein
LSKAVLGERVWLNRRSVPIPEHHRRTANILMMISASGVVPLAWGLTALAPDLGAEPEGAAQP